MRTGMNLLLWTGFVTSEHFPLLANLKKTGFDGVELPLFEGDANHYKAVAKELKNLGLSCTTVTVVGTNFVNVMGITVGGKKATFSCPSSTTCTIVTPPGLVGKRAVVVKTRWGTSAKVAADTFKYV